MRLAVGLKQLRQHLPITVQLPAVTADTTSYTADSTESLLDLAGGVRPQFDSANQRIAALSQSRTI